MSIIEKAINKLEKEVGIKTARISRPSANARTKKRTVSNRQTSPVTQPKSFDKATDLSEQTRDRTNTNYIDIDLARLRQLGIVTPDQGKTQIAEQFRIIKRPLLTKAFAKKKQ